MSKVLIYSQEDLDLILELEKEKNEELQQENEKLKADYGTKVQVERDLLKEENQSLKRQLNYLRSGEYYNQLRFENEMLQQVVDTNGVPSEVYDYIDCTHRNTELLKENQELKKQLEENKLNHKQLKDLDKIEKSFIEIKNQQKEFIKYINAYIELLKDKPDLVEEGQKDILEEILSKYKEIIGDDIE